MTVIWHSPNFDRVAVDEVVEGASLVGQRILRPSPTYKAAIAAGLIGGCVLVLAFGTRPERQRALEATARMERLATTLARAQTIAPDTARQIAHLIRQPQYDCARIRCGAILDRRNRKTRMKFKALLGE